MNDDHHVRERERERRRKNESMNSVWWRLTVHHRVHINELSDFLPHGEGEQEASLRKLYTKCHSIFMLIRKTHKSATTRKANLNDSLLFLILAQSLVALL